MQSMFRKLVAVLSHPIWNSLNCFLTFLIGFGFVGVIIAGVYALLRRLGDLGQFLLEPIEIARILVYFGTALLLWYLATIARSVFLRHQSRESEAPKSAIRPGGYYQFWQVLWKPIPKLFDEMLILGPFCPTHFLEMEVTLENGTYSFICHGGEGNPRHILAGPPYNELIPPRTTIYDPKEYLQNDIRQQVYAELRKSEA